MRISSPKEAAYAGQRQQLQDRSGQTAAAHPFQEGQSGNRGVRRAKGLPGLLAAALDEPVFVTVDGRRRKFTKREAIIARMVDKSASADLRATKMAIDMM